MMRKEDICTMVNRLVMDNISDVLMSIVEGLCSFL